MRSAQGYSLKGIEAKKSSKQAGKARGRGQETCDGAGENFRGPEALAKSPQA